MIIVNIDVMLAKRKMSVTELSERVGITMANISILKNDKAKAIRFSTLEAICEALDCQPGDILEYKERWLFMKFRKSYNKILILLLVAFVGVIGLERLTRPIHLTYVEAVKEVQEENDSFKIIFSEHVSDYELNYYEDLDVNLDIAELTEVVIIAWDSPLNKYIKTSNTKKETFDLDAIDKVLYSELDNEGKNIVVYGANSYEGGSSILPRLAMNYYFILTILLATISFFVNRIFKNKQNIKKITSLIYLFSFSYILSSTMILGFNQVTYFMIRDLSYIIVSSTLLFAMFYNLLIKYMINH